MRLKGEHVWLGGRFMPAVLEIEGGVIQKVRPYGEAQADIDCGAKRVVPGFIDIHTHGAYGFDTNSGDPKGLKEWQQKLPAEGVTAFLATTVTAPKEVLLKALTNVAASKRENGSGAELLGIHLEGPYIDEAYHGAQPLSAIVKPTVLEFEEYQRAAGGLIRVITLAPEHDDSLDVTRYCAQHNVVVSMGHSSATLEQAAMAVANGAKSVTHVYNGMSEFRHRANGMIGAALRIDSLYTEVICDCNHCTPEALNLLFRAKGNNRVVMVSDSLMCKGFPPGKVFRFAELEVEIYSDGSAHLVKEKNFAGSTLKINEGLKNLVERALVPFGVALDSCTVNPATLLGLEDRIGSLTTGHDADIVVLDDDYSILETYCKGEKAAL